MGSKVLILGESGSGKTTSLRNLVPGSTGIANIDRKELPLKGWGELYKTILLEDGKPDLAKSNYVEASKPTSVIMTIEAWEKRPEIETIVLDTITHLITSDYMLNAIGKDFKAYQKIGANFYNILDLIRDSKKNIVVFAHIEKKFNEMGDKVVEMKSHGKMISDLVPPSYFTTVLMTQVDRKDGKTNYQFRTQSDGPDPAKSPAHVTNDGAVTALEYLEPNDVQLILQKLDKFNKGG